MQKNQILVPNYEGNLLTLQLCAIIPGIFVQLPLPKHINDQKILNEIRVEKDVEGFHPLNIGKLAMKGREPLFVPCTPKVLEQLAQHFSTLQ